MVDRYAHNEAREAWVGELREVVRPINSHLLELEVRVTRLEQFRWFVYGGFSVLSLLAAAGGLTIASTHLVFR